VTSSMPCPCSVTVGSVAGSHCHDHAIAAYEQAAFQALAVGAQFYLRRHDTGDTPVEAATELDLLARHPVHACRPPTCSCWCAPERWPAQPVPVH
jgi:hypothetical protein